MADKKENSDFIKVHRKWENWQREQLEIIKKEHNESINKEQNIKDFYGDCDHPNTMENSTATVLYILVMIGSLIFNDFLLIWVVATFIYFRFITRHKR